MIDHWLWHNQERQHESPDLLSQLAKSGTVSNIWRANAPSLFCKRNVKECPIHKKSECIKVLTLKKNFTKNPVVTIGISLYNKEALFAKTLKSVLAQTYQNLEILIVDDKSTDNSLEIAEIFAKTDKRINIIRHTTNRGLACTHNTILEDASGKYLLMWDADDLLYKNAINNLVTIAEKHRSVIVKGRLERHNDHKRPIWIKPESRINISFADHPELIEHFSINAFLMRTAFLEKNTLRFKPGALSDDMIFRAQVLLLAKNKISLYNEYVGKYVYYSDSLSRTDVEKKAESILNGLLTLHAFIKNHKFGLQYNNSIGFTKLMFWCSLLYFSTKANKGIYPLILKNFSKLSAFLSNTPLEAYLLFCSIKGPNLSETILTALALAGNDRVIFQEMIENRWQSAEKYLEKLHIFEKASFRLYGLLILRNSCKFIMQQRKIKTLTQQLEKCTTNDLSPLSKRNQSKMNHFKNIPD